MRLAVVINAIVIGALVASPARADIRLSIDNGRVTLVAKDATVAQILAEWARVGQTKIVNAERLGGPPVTLELTGVSEEMALGIILRSASGYLVAPRAAAVANASRFNRILIMPTSTPPRPSAAPAPPPFPQPPFPQPAFGPPPSSPDEAAPELDLVPRDLPTPNPRTPVFQTFPMPQTAPQAQPAQQSAPPAPSTAAPAPTVPIGVAVPGMPVPVPQQPAQPVPQQPGRRP